MAGDEPENRLERPRGQKDLVVVVEIGKVGINLQHPVGLRQDHGPDIEQRHLS